MLQTLLTTALMEVGCDIRFEMKFHWGMSDEPMEHNG
jgi:hypothetical protein